MKQPFTIPLIAIAAILLTGCTPSPRPLPSEPHLIQEKAITFYDNVSADLWRTEFNEDIYKLADGTVLLTIQDPEGPENVIRAGVDGFRELNNSAQDAVRKYYEEQGLLYDTPLELNNAYSEYLECKKNGESYSGRHISQSISPTASNDKIICFFTSVTLPVSGQTSKEIRLGAVFERETGSNINAWDLFSVSQEEAKRFILDSFAETSPSLRAEMEAALKPEFIVLFSDNLEVTFPEGTLSSQENGYGTSLDYDQLKELLHPWAVPDKNKT